jgi:hypothetical protein
MVLSETPIVEDRSTSSTETKVRKKKKNQTPQPNTFEPLIVFWAWQQEP